MEQELDTLIEQERNELEMSQIDYDNEDNH